MHESIRELKRLKITNFLFQMSVVFGTLIVFAGIFMGLRMENPFSIGPHSIMILSGFILVLVVNLVSKMENTFAQKYHMTHILDIDNKQERYEAYLEHLSNWIASDMEQINPVRGRGTDPSGPDWGKTDFEMGKEPVRRDAIVEGQKYQGMEGELTSTEKMVEKANQEYADYAQKRWEKSESEDPDLIEYGVERLGDLVRTDYFEKNAEEGAFEKIAKPDEESH